MALAPGPDFMDGLSPEDREEMERRLARAVSETLMEMKLAGTPETSQAVDQIIKRMVGRSGGGPPTVTDEGDGSFEIVSEGPVAVSIKPA